MDRLRPVSWHLAIFAVVTGSIGLFFLIEGGRLAMLGGSLYYLLSGMVLIASAGLTWRGKPLGRWMYAFFLLATLLWAIWEVGFDIWQLLARVFAPLVWALYLLLPWTGRALARAGGEGASIERGRTALAVVSGATALALVGAGFSPAPSYLEGRFAKQQPSPASAYGGSVAGEAAEWRHYGNVQGGDRYSALSAINESNVAKLRPLWSIRTGTEHMPPAYLSAIPLMVGGHLYTCTQANVLFALDADTGKTIWRFDPHIHTVLNNFSTCRGVAYQETPSAADCPARILMATLDARLIALDARTGRRCSSFGANGEIDLTEGLGPIRLGFYSVDAPPVVVAGNVIVNSHIQDNVETDEPSGVIRGYDVATGKLSWAWDMGRPDRSTAPPPGETYTRSTANSWAPMSADDALGMVYLPTGATTPDFWAGNRSKVADQFGSSVIALDARTGKVRWSFQTTHHDLWDRDVPSQPTLVDLPVNGRIVPALVQATKRGQFFVLDRRTGKPIFPVVERPAPQGAAPGETLSPTQPQSTMMPNLGGKRLVESDMWGMTPIDQLLCRVAFKKLRYEGPETPPAEAASLYYPGPAGGSNWGSVSIDPVRHLMISNVMHVPYTLRLVSRAEVARAMGRTMVPKIVNETEYLFPQVGARFGAAMSPFLSPLQTPCLRPPFGTITAVDLTNGEVVWTQPLGTARDLGPLGVPIGIPLKTGSPNTGGSLITAGGLVFIGASFDATFRAFSAENGKELWSFDLPTNANATPMTFYSQRLRKQVVIIAVGGHGRDRRTLSDHIYAFALPTGA